MILDYVPIILLYIISTFGAVFYNVFKTKMARVNDNGNAFNFFAIAICSAICAILSFLFGGCVITMRPLTILFGALYGVSFMLNLFFVLKAVSLGPLGYTSIIITFSTAISAVFGLIFFNEEITVTKIIGIVVMLVCFYFTANTSDNGEKKATKKWLIICLIDMLFSALCGIFQALQSRQEMFLGEVEQEYSQFLIIAFAVQFVLSLLLCLIFKKKENLTFKLNAENSLIITKIRTFVLYLSLVTLCCFIINFINVYLVGQGDTSIAFPIINGLAILGTLVSSFTIFKEKIKGRQIIGFILGIIAIVLLLFPKI